MLTLLKTATQMSHNDLASTADFARVRSTRDLIRSILFPSNLKFISHELISALHSAEIFLNMLIIDGLEMSTNRTSKLVTYRKAT